MTRSWVYGRMNNDATLTALIPGGVHASTSLDKTPASKPFIMYRVIAHVPDMRGDDTRQTESESFLIFAHSAPGDYLAIDAILARLKVLFDNVVDQANNIVRSTWIETSEDFRDEDMGTILKYCRIQVKSRV
jgi:hypothetical protein